MTERELSISLREMARVQSHPLCDKWYGEWKDDTSVDGLLDKYVRGIDFGVMNDYPPLDFIRKNFKKEDLHRHNIYIDEEVNIVESHSGIWVLLGKCSGRMTFDSWAVATVHVRHESNMRIDAEDLSRVFVSVYENAECEAKALFGAVVKKYDKKKKEG